MPSWVDVYGWAEGFDENGLFYASFNPVMFRGKNSDVVFSEVMLVVSCVLQHSRFVFAKCVGSCRGVLMETSSNRAFRFAYVSTWAWRGVCPSAGDVVDMSYGFLFFELVFGAYKRFPEGSPGADGGAEPISF